MTLKAKAAHFADGKKVEVYAQEASQIVGMIHQREEITGVDGASQE